MKNKKGFTLIELLAVIVILAIIALIAVPTIKSVLDDAKKTAFENTAYGIIKAGDLYYARKDMNGEINGEIEFTFPNNVEGLEVQGELPESGQMKITEDGDITVAISNGKYCITKGYYETEVKISEDVDNCYLPYTLKAVAVVSAQLGVNSIEACIEKGQVCEIDEDGVAFAIQVSEEKTYKFYVLNDDGNTITLIMAQNLYEDGNTEEPDVAWINAEDYASAGGTNYGSYGNNEKGPLTAINALDARTADWDYIPLKPYTYSGIGRDGTTRRYEDITRTMKARILTYEEATSKGCTTSNGYCPIWLYENLKYTGDTNTYGYWTSTANDPSSRTALRVNHKGNLDNGYVDGSSNGYGVRPVIELSK